MGRQTQVRARSPNGDNFDLTAHESDSPILPVVQLQQLHSFRPDLVDWVKQQTEDEANSRRARELRVDRYVLAERMGGLFFGGLISLAGLLIAAYVALHGQPWVAGILGGGTLVGIVTVLVTGKPQGERMPRPPDTPSTTKTKRGE